MSAKKKREKTTPVKARQLAVRMSDQLAEEIALISEARDWSLAYITREALQQFVARELPKTRQLMEERALAEEARARIAAARKALRDQGEELS